MYFSMLITLKRIAQGEPILSRLERALLGNNLLKHSHMTEGETYPERLSCSLGENSWEVIEGWVRSLTVDFNSLKEK